MLGIKGIFVVLFSCLFIVFMVDVMHIFQANMKIDMALSHAMDAALTKTINEQKLAKGKQSINENQAKQEAHKMLMKSLRLNHQLENENYQKSKLDSKIMNEEHRVKMTVRFTTHLPIHVVKIFGIKTVPIRFVKTKSYYNDYI